MANFGEVFSTTWKVLLTLFLIYVGLGLIYLVIVGIARSASNSSSAHVNTYLNDTQRYDDRADQRHTRMPQSMWSKKIAAAIESHCIDEGMTREEAEKAIGKPNTATFVSSHGAGNRETWQYQRTTQGKCLKYNGDECAEYETKHESATLYFSPNGHMTIPLEGGYLWCFDPETLRDLRDPPP